MAAINFPNSPTVGQTLIAGTITYTWDGQKWLAGVSAGATGATGVSGPTGATGAQGATGVQANLTAVSTNVVPAANVTYDLGTSSLRWRDLYLSGNSLYLGGATITATGNAIVLPQGSTIGGNVIGTGSSSVTVGNTAPASPTAGSIWFNSNTGELLVYYDDGDSFQWIQPIGSAGAATVLVSNAQPANVSIGTLWLNSDTGRLLAYYSDGVQPYWIQPVGAAGPTGATGVAGTAGTAGATGATGAGSFAFANSAPASPVVGARWLNSDSMIEYIYVNDGTSTQWVQPTNLSQTGATGATGPVAGSSGQIIYNSANVAAGSANLTFDGTTVTMAANPVLSAGTANGVLYLNGSKAATSGNTLIYDGSALTSSGGNPSAYFKIGSTAPLFAMGWADNTIYHRIKSAGGANDGIQIQLKNDAASLVLSNTPDFFFIINGSEQMRLTSTGLGIGTSSPLERLDVRTTGSGRVSIRLASGGTNQGYISYFDSGQYLAFGSGASTGSGVNGGEQLVLNNAGNLGLGVTPSAWSGKAIEVGSKGTAIWNLNQVNTSYTCNAYYDGAFKYGGTGLASSYQQAAGIHYWYTAPSGTAGNTISFTQAMTLDASGNLGIGTTLPVAKLDVISGTNTTLSVPAGVVAKFSGSIVINSLSTASSGNIDSLYFQKSHGSGINISNYDLGIIRSYTSNGYAGGLDFYTGKLTGPGAYAATFAMRIDDNQRMLINTTVAPALGGYLVVNSGINTSSTTVIELQQATNGANKAAAGFGLAIQNGGQSTNAADLIIATASGGSLSERVRITSDGVLQLRSGATDNQLQFFDTGGTIERVRIGTNGSNLDFLVGSPITPSVRITSAGEVLVGTTALIYGNSGNIQSFGSSNFVAGGNSGSATCTALRMINNNSGVTVGTITYGASSTAYNTTSDYRLKNTIAPMTGALAKVQQLKPVTYKWNADGSDGEGFIAHELAEVCPQAVTGEKDAVDAEGKPVYQGVDTSFLVATLTAAIQEQQAMIQQQQAMLNELKAEVAALKGN
jgi:hypothetical protein